MRCDRLEGEDLLGDLGEELDGHIEQCPDCSARVREYRRIASWIAEGKTGHRAPASWQQRTLATVLATPPLAPSSTDQAGREFEGPATASAVADTDRCPVSPPRSAATTLSESAAARVSASESPHRKRWPRVVFAVACAAMIVVVASTVLLPRDDAATSLALRSESPRSTQREDTPPESQSSLPATEPTARAIEPQATAPQRPAPESAAINRRGRSGAAPTREGLPGPAGERRGGAVIVDWGERADPTAPIAPGPATIEVVIETVPPGAQVLLGNAVLGTTPFRRSVPQDADLVIRLRGYRDVAIVASRRVTRPIELVPIKNKTGDAHEDDQQRTPERTP